MRGWRLTDQDPTRDGDPVPTLQQLIRARMDERGWSLADLERQSGGRLTKSRWQQLASGARFRSWPEPATIHVLVDVLGFDFTTVVLASAMSLDLPVNGRGPLLAQLLPAGTDLLSERMRSAILAMIRAAVEDAATRTGSDVVGLIGGVGVYEWAKLDDPSPRRNTPPRAADSD